MSEPRFERRQAIQTALLSFSQQKPENLKTAAIALLNALGYRSDKTADFGSNAEELLTHLESQRPDCPVFNRAQIYADQWLSCAFLFQLTDDEIPLLATPPSVLNAPQQLLPNQIESLVFLAIELKGETWSRTQFARITRELNRRFPMPAIVLFRYGDLLSLAVIDRRVNLRDSTQDVIYSRITVIKDICSTAPHRAHFDILSDLTFSALIDERKQRPAHFRALYDAWIAVLSIQTLNQRFYTDLSWWYFWTLKQVQFPLGGGANAEQRNAVAVIRLLTRLIFVWFIKEKGLIPAALFDPLKLKEVLKIDPAANGEAGNYYCAIVQNLFFATLNVERGALRKWATTGSGMKNDRLIHSVYRYKELFCDDTAALELFAGIPFLNGGLFECLDRELTERDFERNPELQAIANQEGNGWVLRIDGFSRRREAQAVVPNRVFFNGELGADLNADLGTKNKRYNVNGLFDIFARYKFTVEENMPLEEEVALDPELLGKVFENLLASYNAETQTTARKQSGSFYTPREVVDYMVDEALLAYFTQAVTVTDSAEFNVQLRDLLAYTTDGNPCAPDATAALIGAIEALRILDPACGSGAFPMGVLNKLVHLLRKLDPNNALWRAQNRAHLEANRCNAESIPDLVLRDEKIQQADDELDKFDRTFSQHHADYTRKLYLINKCIHGIDLQPIAVQIAKLRFFIALIVSQKVDFSAPENFGITALPNLETKIIAADSLTPIAAMQMALRDPRIDEKEHALIRANESYFSARTSKTKRKWRDRIGELRDELALLLKADQFVSAETVTQLVHWNPFDQNAAAGFFDPHWMFQMNTGFDIVIGNPPYVRQEAIKHLKVSLKQNYDCFTGTADLYVYFFERAVKLLKPHGVLSFITSNKWYRAKYGTKLRQWLNLNTQLRQLLDFGDEAVFTAIAYPTIVIATRRPQPVQTPAASEQIRVLNWAQQAPIETFPAVFAAESFDVPQSELKEDGWQLEPPLQRQLLARIRQAGTPLDKYVHGRFYYGIKTGLNEAFVIDGATRARLIAADPNSAEVIKPFLRGRDVKRWQVVPQDLWLIFTRRPFQIENYPAIAAHLEQFKPQLMPKPDDWEGEWLGRASGNYEWHEIQTNTAYWEEFEQPKIIVPAITNAVNYAPDIDGFYSNDKTSIIISTEWRYLLSVLNSTVSWWWSKQLFASKANGFFEFKPMYVGKFPIPDATAKQQAILEALVTAILNVAELRFEQLINALVYELYFPADLHCANIHLFAICEQANIQQLVNFDDAGIHQYADHIFAADHPIAQLLVAVQKLPVVRLIEGRD
jgi:adenine-specific DNA-methyltransferase